MRSRKKEGVYFMSILKRQVLFVLFAFAATLCVFAQNRRNKYSSLRIKINAERTVIQEAFYRT